METEEEREMIKAEIVDLLRKRGEPYQLGQIAYQLKYKKTYVEEECMPQLTEQIACKSINRSTQLYFIPTGAQNLIGILDSFDSDFALTVDS